MYQPPPEIALLCPVPLTPSSHTSPPYHMHQEISDKESNPRADSQNHRQSRELNESKKSEGVDSAIMVVLKNDEEISETRQKYRWRLELKHVRLP